MHGGVAGHVAERRAGTAARRRRQAEALGERDGAGDQRVAGVHHALGLAGGAGGEHQQRQVVGLHAPSRPAGGGASRSSPSSARRRRARPRRRPPAHGAAPAAAGCSAAAIAAWSKPRNSRGTISTLASAKSQHEAQLALAEDRHQRVDDRADAARRPARRPRTPTSSAVARPRCRRARRRAAAAGGGARDQVAEFGIGEAAPLGAIGAKASSARFSGVSAIVGARNSS